MLRFLTFLGGLFALGLALISIGANFWFGRVMFSGLEGWLFGSMFALLDGLKTVLPVIAAAAFTAGSVTKGRVAVLVFGLLTVLSFTAEIGLYATTKSETVGDAKAAHELYEQAKTAKAKADADLAALGTTRPAGEIAGELAALKRDRLYDRAKQCTDATAAESRALCASVDRLAGEHAKALEAAALRQAAANAAVALQKQDVAAAMRVVDPQAQALAKLVSPVADVDPDTVRTALAVLIALLIELGSGLGPWLAAPNAARQTKTYTNQTPATTEVASPPASPTRVAGDVDEDLVARWGSTVLVKRRGAFLPAAEARAAFATWCSGEGVEPMNPTAFGKAMTEAGYERRKVGGVMRYEGIALSAGQRTVRLAVDNASTGQRERVLGGMHKLARANGSGS